MNNINYKLNLNYLCFNSHELNNQCSHENSKMSVQISQTTHAGKLQITHNYVVRKITKLDWHDLKGSLKELYFRVIEFFRYYLMDAKYSGKEINQSLQVLFSHLENNPNSTIAPELYQIDAIFQHMHPLSYSPFSMYYANSSFTEEQKQILGLSHSPLIIFLFKEDLQRQPTKHLVELTKAISCRISEIPDYRIQINYLEGVPATLAEMKNDFSSRLAQVADTGGVARDYLLTLTRGLIKKLPFHWIENSQSYLPYCKNLTEESINIFESLGRLIMYCYHAQDTVKTDVTLFIISRFLGHYFDDSLFYAALSLEGEEIENRMSFEGKKKICKALVEHWVNKGESVEWLALRLNQIPAKLDSDESIKQFLLDFGIEENESFNNYLLEAIQDEDKFKEKVICKTIEKTLGIDPTLFFEPLFAIAHGMKKFSHPGQKKCNNDENKDWNQLIKNINYQKFSCKVQGSALTSEIKKSIANSIVVDESCNEKIKHDVNCIKSWLIDPATLEDDIRVFLKFTTGATSLREGQIIRVYSAPHRGIVPKASTCSLTLTFPSEYPEEFGNLPVEQQKNEFIRYLLQEMRRTMNFFDIR